MPRKFDFAAESTAENYDRFGVFTPFLDDEGEVAKRYGKGELSEAELWPDGDFFSGVSHQYELFTPKGVSPYDNALVDPIHDWLSQNCQGPWHWIESLVNNYRSVDVCVYLQEPADQERFEGAWSASFRRRDWAFRHNEKHAAKTGARP